MSCSDSEYYKVLFDNVNQLKAGDEIIINGQGAGQIKELRIVEENKVLATIWIGRNIKLTQGTTFEIQSNVYGVRHLEIKLSTSKELINPEDIQHGSVQSPVMTDAREFTQEEIDSLITRNPAFQILDTVLNTLRRKNKSAE